MESLVKKSHSTIETNAGFANHNSDTQNVNGYNARKSWNEAAEKHQMAYPPEYVIRIFKGGYPRLNFDKSQFPGKKILDMGCGDGRNFPLFAGCGFKLFGVELTDEIVTKTGQNLSNCGLSDFDLRTGCNHSIPFEDQFFDYMVSWNSCYYMGAHENFGDYVEEFARVIKPGGTLVLSIPKKSCFIYDSSIELRPGYRTIQNDFFNTRNGEILRCFGDAAEIEQAFSPGFANFEFASIHDDCFGLNYHWHLAICTRR